MFCSGVGEFFYKPYIVGGMVQRGRVVLLSRLVWRVVGVRGCYVVPVGFVCDLASIPWISSFAFDKLGRHQRAAVLHDWFYRNRVESKAWADAQFRRAMEIDGVVWWRRWVIWSGVAAFGWVSWWRRSGVLVVGCRGES